MAIIRPPSKLRAGPAGLSVQDILQRRLITIDEDLASGASSMLVSQLSDIFLEDGHYELNRQTFEIVHPRPDSETVAWESHRIAHPGVLYREWLAFRGGSIPVWGRLTSNTTAGGATLGGAGVGTYSGPIFNGTRYVFPSDYLEVNWLPTTTETVTIEVELIDQFMNTTTMTWTVSADPANWWIIAAGGDNSNAGTVASPFATTEAVISGRGQRGVMLRGNGESYALFSTSGSQNFQIDDQTSHPIAFTSYGTETPQLTMDDTWFNPGLGASGFKLKGLELRHEGSSSTRHQKMVANGGTARTGISGCTISRFYSNGSGNPDNPAVLFISSSPSGRDYVFYAHNQHSGQQGAAFHTFRTNMSACHNNLWTSDCQFTQFHSSNNSTIFLKDTAVDASIRMNDFRAANHTYTNNQGDIGWRGQNGGITDVEIQYNYMTRPAQARSAGLRAGVNDQNNPGWTRVYVDRNTISSSNTEPGATPVAINTVQRNRNVLHSGNNFEFQNLVDDTDNLEGATNFVDSDGHLTGSFTQWLGLRGAEIA